MLSFNYQFKNKRRGSADGTVFLKGLPCLDLPETTVTFYWGVEFGGGVMPLPEYTPIAVITGKEAQEGYVIDKELCIPTGVCALLAHICGGDTDGTATYTLPEEKITDSRGEPLYTVGFASDFHLGGWGSEKAPKEGLLKARDGFNRLVDFLVTEGDLVQWHGCFSGEEFKKYNYNKETNKWGDNGERDPQFVETGRSQWEMLEEYMSGFTIPVYHCQGNHDIIDEDHWSPVCGNRDYFGEYLTRHIKASEESGKYKRHITRDESVHYYETVINGHKFVFTEAPHPHKPHDVIGKEELRWLDRVLFDGEESGKPIFVMGHSPIDPRLNKKTAYAKFTDLDELKRILAKHPTVIYVSGHSHFTLDTPLRNALDGRQEIPSHLHNGGMTTVIDPPPMTQYNVTHGTVAEVYGDGILIRGRNFTTGEWISLAHSEMIFKNPCASGNVWVEKSDGVLFAKSEKPDGIEFEWYQDGTLVSSEDHLSIPNGFDGYVVLRAKDADGGFKSVLYNSINDI